MVPALLANAEMSAARRAKPRVTHGNPLRADIFTAMCIHARWGNQKMGQPERTTMFLHFDPQESLPRVGETVRQHSAMTDIWYRVTIHKILGETTLLDGRRQLKVVGTRVAEE